MTPTINSHGPGLLRREDARLLRGSGQFVGNLNLKTDRHLAFVRSPVAKGRLRRLQAPPDEACGFTLLGADLAQGLSMPAINPLLPLEHAYDHPLLPREAVSYVGQPLALVVADTADDARRIAESCVVDIDSEPAVLDFDQTGVSIAQVSHQYGQAESAAHAGVSTLIHCPRVAAMSMEPRCVIARWDDDTRRLTIWLASQSPARARSHLAEILTLHEDAIDVISPDVGGAFGTRASLGPEELLIALAVRRIGGSLKWQATRSEEFVAGVHGRGSRLSGQLQANASGSSLQLSAQLEFTLGAWLPFSAVVPLRNAARVLPGPYRLQSANISGNARRSNTAPVNIYRGAGRPEGTLLMETLIERLARRLDIDPVALRRRNLVHSRDMPWRNACGELIDSGNFPELLDRACARFDYQGARAQQTRRRQAGECVGIGMALYAEPCGQGFESASLTLDADGRITVASGSPAQGQGHETSFAQIAWRELSPELGCRFEDIRVLMGDTRSCPPGIGALASRSIAIGGSAIVQACRELLRRLRESPGQRPLTVNTRFTADEAWASGCVIAQLRIDVDTGQPTIERLVWCDDAGHIVSPELAYGQLIGGLAQGVGQIMMERLVYDPDAQLLTGTLMDYALPRATDIPSQIDIDHIETLSPNNLLGSKGVGEAGCIGVPAAIMNAALDALAPYTEARLDLPLSSEQLWRALHRPD